MVYGRDGLSGGTRLQLGVSVNSRRADRGQKRGRGCGGLVDGTWYRWTVVFCRKSDWGLKHRKIFVVVKRECIEQLVVDTTQDEAARTELTGLEK